jgi:hypothetical protein
MRSLRWIPFAAAIFVLAAPIDLWGQNRGKRLGQTRAQGSNEAWVSVDDDSDDDSEDNQGNLNDLRRGQVLVLRDERGRSIIVDRGDIERRFRLNNERRRAPAFCRSGEGHPVWGPEWCIERGYGLGTRRIVLEHDRVYFPLGNDVVVARHVVVRDDRSWVERTVDRVLFWAD